jgi:hypothetical protein
MSGVDDRKGIQAEFDGLLGRFRLKISLTIPPKGITALVGSSGAGKTSLLRAIAGLTRLPGIHHRDPGLRKVRCGTKPQLLCLVDCGFEYLGTLGRTYPELYAVDIVLRGPADPLARLLRR